MTYEAIRQMALECGLTINGNVMLGVEHFAKLVAAAEREICARVCEETTAAWTQHLYNEGCIDCAKSIRARGNE